MTQHWASRSIVVCSLLALPPILSASPAPRTGDPCKQLHHTLDQQIDDTKARQKDEFKSCQHEFGRNAAACLALKDQQQDELNRLRADRAGRMVGCSGPIAWNTRTGLPGATSDFYADHNDSYTEENDAYYKHHHHHHHHHHPYPHDNGKTPAVVAKGGKSPEKTPGREQVPRTEHGVASQSSSHGANHSGTPAAAATEHGPTHSGSASSASTYSGGHGGGASYSGSSSSGGSSHTSGGGGSYSGGSSSSGGSSPSPAPASQNTGGGHPK